MRDVFDDGAFVVENEFGTKIRVLKEDGGESTGFSQAKDARRMRAIVTRGVYDLVRKGYIDKLVFAIIDKNTDYMIEQYLFQYKSNNSVGLMYEDCKGNENETELSIGEKNNIAASFKYIVRGLQAITETLDVLPKEFRCKLYVTYKPDAPNDYKPSFFSEFTGDSSSLQFPDQKAVSMNLGKVKTGSHELSVRMRVHEDVLEEEDSEKEVSAGQSAGHPKIRHSMHSNSVPVAQMTKNDSIRKIPGPPKLNRHPRKISNMRRPTSVTAARSNGRKMSLNMTDSENDFTDSDDHRFAHAQKIQRKKAKRSHFSEKSRINEAI